MRPRENVHCAKSRKDTWRPARLASNVHYHADLQPRYRLSATGPAAGTGSRQPGRGAGGRRYRLPFRKGVGPRLQPHRQRPGPLRPCRNPGIAGRRPHHRQPSAGRLYALRHAGTLRHVQRCTAACTDCPCRLCRARSQNRRGRLSAQPFCQQRPEPPDPLRSLYPQGRFRPHFASSLHRSIAGIFPRTPHGATRFASNPLACTIARRCPAAI